MEITLAPQSDTEEVPACGSFRGDRFIVRIRGADGTLDFERLTKIAYCFRGLSSLSITRPQAVMDACEVPLRLDRVLGGTQAVCSKCERALEVFPRLLPPIVEHQSIREAGVASRQQVLVIRIFGIDGVKPFRDGQRFLIVLQTLVARSRHGRRERP